MKRINLGHPNKIESFEIVTLHTSGMRFTTEREIVMRDGEAEITEYAIRYNEGETIRVPQAQVTCSAQQVLQLLNDCRLLAWDGFYGPHPKHVLDGTMFRLTATVNGDQTIRANGSQNFPRHYRDFTDGLYALLHPDN